MGRYEREKGARAEREFAEICRAAGFTEAHRAGQAMYQRGSEVADVEGLPFIHVECKAVERLNLRAAMEQSAKDAEDEGRGHLPIVAHKQRRRGWYITMRIADWLRIFKAALRGARQQAET